MDEAVELKEPLGAEWAITQVQELPSAVELFGGIIRIEPYEGGRTKIQIVAEGGFNAWATLDRASAEQVAAWLLNYSAHTPAERGNGREGK